MPRQYISYGFLTPLYIDETRQGEAIAPVEYIQQTDPPVRQRNSLLHAIPHPVYVTETGKRQAIASYKVYINETIVPVVGFPAGVMPGEPVFDLAPASKVPPDQVQLHSWTASYNLNLIGKDRMLVGEQVWQLAPSQVVPPDQVQIHSWQWSYNLNLIGQDRLPVGEQVYTLVPAQVVPPEQPQLHSWQWNYNLNLIGQDRLPTGKQFWERPQLPIPPAQTWVETPQYELIAKPFNQQDWPNPTQPYRIDQTWTASYNKNLIGQDAMIVGEQRTELPDRGPLRSQDLLTWIQIVNLALTTAPAVPNTTISKLYDRPILPIPPAVGWEASFNKNLIGQDQLPFRQQDWPNPQRVVERAQTWIDQTKIQLTAVQNPFRQSDWPAPTTAQQPIQSWTSSFNLNLVGQDKLPFRQSDWPLTPSARPGRDPTLDSWTGRFNLNLIGQDRLPNRQQDWSLPAGHILNQIPLQIMVQGTGFWLTPPQPLPPGAQLYARTVDPARGSADLAWPAWRWPQITPPPVSGVIPLRTLMGTGV